MTRGRGIGSPGAAGGLAPHIPVLARRVVEFLAPRDGALYVDATFGAGGHSRLILDAADCRVIGIDRDQSAIALGADLVEAAQGRLVLVEERFSDLQNVLASMNVAAVDGVVIDLGVSSMQLDQPQRGFSFRHDGPLDMRMSGSGPTAADVIAAATERDLAAVVRVLGEERFARQIARAIVSQRERAPIRTTRALADIVGSVVHARPGDIHPATRTFQALRMFVNQELEELAAALAAAERVLSPTGRLVVIAFHSLEDRIVKRFLTARSRAPAVSRHQPPVGAHAATFRMLTPKAIVADNQEVAANPRARSAKLRAAERTPAPPSPMAIETYGELPALADMLRGR
ncbi:MAG TPA: 16S rRNA (cytosine(1402)-N(4))-methyltransferase RsmH [Xanthobacteraceae bacterium]|nr:16S rRNA (cytosine(1402)-N(4))-methyltransferase RsmH [Xanthobacteraceae bacterium]